MEIDYILLGLIKLYGEVSGYELNRIIQNSNRYFIAVSLAYIYPILKRLYQRRWVTYTVTPIPNRPDKKSYRITQQGEKALQVWLEAPIEPDMYFRSFLLKMQFAALMSEETIRAHLEREIEQLEKKIQDVNQLHNCIESGKLDAKSCEVLSFMMQLLLDTNELRIEWLKRWLSKLTERDSISNQP
ncbi:MAG: PadR family transcriptional regulator [Anaerolineales bacterium]|jgi:DNA-binding PadR family transcriptional regulator